MNEFLHIFARLIEVLHRFFGLFFIIEDKATPRSFIIEVEEKCTHLDRGEYVKRMSGW
jgi:hypothetical protein